MVLTSGAISPPHRHAPPACFAGLTTGVICFFSVRIKEKLGFDDALDAFGMHGVGGIYGGIVTGLFANPKARSGQTAKSRTASHVRPARRRSLTPQCALFAFFPAAG